MSIDVNKISLVQWLLIIILGLLGLACLLVAAWQFRLSALPSNSSKILIRSIVCGLMVGGFSVSLSLLWGVLLWSETGYLKSMAFPLLPILCLTPFLIITMVGTSLLHFWYVSKLKRYISSVGTSEYSKKG